MSLLSPKDHPFLFWFVVLMVIFFLLWLSQGGHLKKDEGLFMKPVAPLGNGETYDEPILKK